MVTGDSKVTPASRNNHHEEEEEEEKTMAELEWDVLPLSTILEVSALVRKQNQTVQRLILLLQHQNTQFSLFEEKLAKFTCPCNLFNK